MLDVGTGSGILAIWSAQAGAKKVYAVEATTMADHARALVKANGLEHIVEVIQASVEDISLPEKGIVKFTYSASTKDRESVLSSFVVTCYGILTLS